MKIIFWNVDTQYDFMRDDDFKGALPVPNARQIEGNLAKLTNLAETEKIQVVNTADWHNKDSKEFADNPDFINTFPPHCIQYTKGADYVPATNPKNPYKTDWQDNGFDKEKIATARNIVIYKDAFDVFTGNPHTEKILQKINPDIAVVYGVATNVCVDFAVNGLLERKVQVYVPTDAVKELPGMPLPYDNWTKKGATLTQTKDIYKILEGRV